MKKTAFLKTAFLALAFCMAFVLIPNSNASVSASEMPSGHTCDGVTYDIPLDSSFTGGTLASGNYYLTEDITLAKKLRSMQTPMSRYALMVIVSILKMLQDTAIQ